MDVLALRGCREGVEKLPKNYTKRQAKFLRPFDLSRLRQLCDLGYRQVHIVVSVILRQFRGPASSRILFL